MRFAELDRSNLQEMTLALAGAFELAAELGEVEAVLGDFAIAKEDDGHIDIVQRAKFFVGINVHFAQTRAEFAEQRGHLRFCFFAKMAALASVERDFDFRRNTHQESEVRTRHVTTGEPSGKSEDACAAPAPPASLGAGWT